MVKSQRQQQPPWRVIQPRGKRRCVGCRGEPHRKPACAARRCDTSMQECRLLALGCLKNSAWRSKRQTPVQQVRAHHTSCMLVWAATAGEHSKYLKRLPRHKNAHSQALHTYTVPAARPRQHHRQSKCCARMLLARHLQEKDTRTHTSARQLPGYKKETGTSRLTPPHKAHTPSPARRTSSTAAQGGSPARNNQAQLPDTHKSCGAHC